MKKTPLTAAQQFELRQALHVATLDALLASRRWQPGELVFQGGTSLHLAHGSPRFSEDLDFLVHSTLDLTGISAAIEARLAGTPWLPTGTKLTVSKAKDAHNPHAFVVAVGGPKVIGAVRVKVKLWQTTKESMASLGVSVHPVRLASGLGAGAQAFVPTADLSEIFADKVFAVGARPYMKPRDLFDLRWILQRKPGGVVTQGELETRLDMYPNETPTSWLKKAEDRLDSLPKSVPAVKSDLQRWLPSHWQIGDAEALEIVNVSVAALTQAIVEMRVVATKRPAPAQAAAAAAAPRTAAAAPAAPAQRPRR